jgi:hypothetical protein
MKPTSWETFALDFASSASPRPPADLWFVLRLLASTAQESEKDQAQVVGARERGKGSAQGKDEKM